MNSAIIIPALNPTYSLVDYVSKLINKGANKIIIVNDGSKSSQDDIFNLIAILPGCVVLKHKINLGKGQAIKTAIKYILENDIIVNGVITADCDGQHLVEDVFAISKNLMGLENGIVLGMRDFNQANVPFRSRFGNKTTSWLFSVLYGQNLRDTQTGLRGIPWSLLPWMLELKGERFEYEINMLIYARKKNIKFVEVPISTIYFNANSGSHYSTIRDSTRIFISIISGLVQYSLSSIISSLIDASLFFVLVKIALTHMPAAYNILLSTVIARVTSSVVNYTINRRLIFAQHSDVRATLPKYYFLWGCQLIASYYLTYSAFKYLHWDAFVSKLVTDLILATFSYQIQLKWVFSHTKLNSEGNV